MNGIIHIQTIFESISSELARNHVVIRCVDNFFHLFAETKRQWLRYQISAHETLHSLVFRSKRPETRSSHSETTQEIKYLHEKWR